ncbi:MAG: OB-fold domain-containing protein [Dehalococcoidia bacterium]|nr:OB-fold domain-containing protein [Dehalococcoidia bacterium]
MPYMPAGMPIPDVKDPQYKDWWAFCKQHKLVIQRCAECGTFRHLPDILCYKCHSFKYEWHPVSGKGVVYSYIIPYHPAHPALKGRVPYNVVIVELSDAGNVRMVGNIVDCPNEQVKVGMPVEVTWEDVNDSVTLPQWKLSNHK